MILKFNDNKNREIIISEGKWGEDIIAFHNDNEIGRFEFSTIDPEDSMGPKYGIDSELVHMEVVRDFKRTGIGSKLMQASVEFYHDFKLPTSYGGPKINRPKNYLTAEGAALVNYCFDQDILPERFRNYIRSIF